MSDEEYFEQLVSSSLDGTLTNSEREKLEEHLAECPSCAALKQDLEQMRALFAEETELPEGLHEDIMQKLEQENKLRVVQPEKPARRMPVFTMVAAAAVVVLVVLGGGLMPAFSTVGSGSTTASNNAAAEGAAYGDAAAGQAVQDAADNAGLTAGSDADSGQTAGGAAENAQTIQPRGDIPADSDPASDGSQPSASVQVDGEESTGESKVWEGLQPSEKSGTGADQTPQVNVALAEALPVLKLPSAVSGTSVAHCYFADGGDEIPDLDGKLVATIDGISWFLLDNNMTTLQNTLAQLEEADFTVSAYENVGLTMDSKATSWLLIVQTAV